MNVCLYRSVTLLVISAAGISIAQETPAVPPEALETWTRLIGHWTVDGSVGPQSVTGEAHVKWATGKHCYLGEQNWQIEGTDHPLHLTQIAGWNAKTRETIEQGFSSLGDTATVQYRTPAAQSKTVEGTIHGVSQAGAEWSGTIRLEHQGPDQFNLSTIVDGTTIHALKYVRKNDVGGTTDK